MRLLSVGGRGGGQIIVSRQTGRVFNSLEWSAMHDSIGTTRSEREEEVPDGYSLGLGEGRGFVGLCGPCRVVIGCALILRPHLHDGLFGLIFSMGNETNALALKLSPEVLVTWVDNGSTR